MNMRNATRPYSDRRFYHRNKMERKVRERSLSRNRIARADRATNAAMIPF